MSMHNKTLKKAVCVDILAVFAMFLHHFCLKNPYLWGVPENLFDALIFILYPPSASTLAIIGSCPCPSCSMSAAAKEGILKLGIQLFTNLGGQFLLRGMTSLPRHKPIEWVKVILTRLVWNAEPVEAQSHRVGKRYFYLRV